MSVAHTHTHTHTHTTHAYTCVYTHTHIYTHMCTDLLGTDFVKRLLTTVCAFLRSKTREVVRSTLDFMKVTIGVLPPDELLSHLEDLVISENSLTSINGKNMQSLTIFLRYSHSYTVSRLNVLWYSLCSSLQPFPRFLIMVSLWWKY